MIHRPTAGIDGAIPHHPLPDGRENLAAKTVFQEVLELSKPVSALVGQKAENNFQITVEPEHVRNAIKRFILGELSADDLEEWANLLEAEPVFVHRRDETEASTRSVIFRLANPNLTEVPLSVALGHELLAAL